MAAQTAVELEAGFDAGDDLLWQAARGQLAQRGPIRLRRSGRVGPVIELMQAQRMFPGEYALVSAEIPFAHLVQDAMESGRISGGNHNDRAGVFPFAGYPSGVQGQAQWEQWALHAQNVAVAHGLKRTFVDGLIGALGELQDNVYEHSEAFESGLAAYAVSAGVFEFVVADAGIGVLASLRRNPEFASVADSGDALKVAASDGASRFDRSTGHGFGIGTLFRALARDAGELRFRSGDHVMSICGDRPSLTGRVDVVQKAWLNGLVVSVRCTPNDGLGGQ